MDAMRHAPLRGARWLVLLLTTVPLGVLGRAPAPTAPPEVPAGSQVTRAELPPASGRAIVALRAYTDEGGADNPDGFDPRQARRPAPPVEGAGFFVTPLGHLITTWDLVNARTTPQRRSRAEQEDAEPEEEEQAAARPADGGRLRLEAVWPGGDGEPPRAFEAKVVASSEELNLALLVVDVRGEVPVVPFGDSDGPDGDERLTAVTLAPPRKGGVDRVPAPSARDRRTTPPLVLPPGIAIPAGRREQVPLAAPRMVATEPHLVRSGNGGPVLDPEGYAVGILHSRLAPAAGPALTIPINTVKDFLEANGLAGLFPARLTLGPPQAFEDKGLRLAVPMGMGDTWPGRTRWLSLPDGSGLGLRIDRVYSTASTADLASALLAGDFGGFPASRDESARLGRRGAHAGARATARRATSSRERATGTAYGVQRDVPWGVTYAVVAAGVERVVAHYTAPADLLAYNRGVLRRALESLEVDKLLQQQIGPPPLRIDFESVTIPASGSPSVRMPAGWVHEPVAEPQPGAGLPPPDVVLSSSPVFDYTMTLRYASWALPPGPPEVAAVAAAGERGRAHGAAFEYQDEVHGVAWVVRGEFSSEGGVLRLHELRVPADRVTHLARVFEEWLGAR